MHDVIVIFLVQCDVTITFSLLIACHFPWLSALCDPHLLSFISHLT